MEKNSRIYVAGHNGLVGSAIVRRLIADGYTNMITRCHQDLDLTSQSAVNDFFESEKPEYVIMCAAKVNGIQANREALDQFMYINTMIEFNTIMAVYNNGVKKYCLAGSECIYPRDCKQPIKEEYLLTSPLEITNEGYALAKISGLKLCEYLNTHHPDKTRFISFMPCNLYGPGDNYHPVHSHVIPALIRKFHEAKINNLSKVGTIAFDHIHSDGTPRKLLDSTRIFNLGWRPKVSFDEGLRLTCENYKINYENYCK